MQQITKKEKLVKDAHVSVIITAVTKIKAQLHMTNSYSANAFEIDRSYLTMEEGHEMCANNKILFA